MKMKKIIAGLCTGATLAATVFSSVSFAGLPYDMHNEANDCMWFCDPAEPDILFWYEKGIKQGTYDDPNGVMGDGTIRGREIYDARSDGWYWLDAVYDGAKARNKEVWMPYIYQDEDKWSDEKIAEVAAESDKASGSEGMADCVIKQIKARGTKEGGKWVRYDKDGRMIKGWYTEDGSINEEQKGNKYFYDMQTGLMAKGDVTIAGVKYHFNEVTGVCESEEASLAVNCDAIKQAPGNYAIEADVDLTGSGNGYHAKLVISNGGAATFSWGIQYDVNSLKDHARSKCALMIENATPAAQSYDWPQSLVVANGAASCTDVHLMLSLDGTTGTVYCFYNNQQVATYTNPALVVTDPINVQIKSEGAADDGSVVVAKFKNVKVKLPYYGKTRIAYKGVAAEYGKEFDNGVCHFESHCDPNVEKDEWGNPNGYELSMITGVNKSQDWDVPNGVQNYVYYTKGYMVYPFKNCYFDY